jgi:hypothetical protein
VLAFENHRLRAKRRLRVGNIVHANPGKDCDDRNPWHPDECRVLDPHGALLPRVARDGFRIAAKKTEDPDGNNERRQELHRRYPEVAKTGIHAERRALALFRKEEIDVGHRRREIATAESAQQSEISIVV